MCYYIYRCVFSEAKMRRLISMILTISILTLCSSCSCTKYAEKPFSHTFKAYDTVCSITIYDDLSKSDWEYIDKKLKFAGDEYNYQLDKYATGSFPKRLNEKKSVKATGDNYDILEESIKYSKLTNGAFDITVSPLVELWGINKQDFEVPKASDINKLLSKVDYKQIKLDDDTAKLTKGGSIDFGAIGKGFIADRIIDELGDYGVSSILLDLGGNIYAHGSKYDKPFKIGIKKPFGKGELSATVKVEDMAVITAGIDQRYQKYKGKIYPHIIDPKTGYPIDNDLYSVTVISEDATTADALSTGFMVMGLDKGLKLANKTEDIEAVFIDKDNKLHLTKGLKMKGKEITIKE